MGEPLLRTTKVTKHFGETYAVHQVDFHVDRSEVLALIGSNGAGKTTLVNLISGLVVADSGTVVFDGQDVTRAAVNARIRAGIARSFQLVNLFDQLSVLDNVRLAVFARDGKTNRMFSIAGRDRAAAAEATDVLDAFGLAGRAGLPAGSLSHGERKLLDVAVAYALKPRLLFLDEPTSGVSTRDKTQIMDTVSAVVRGGGITAVVIEHDMDVVFKYSDRVVVMHEGRFLADGPPEAIRNNADVAK